MFWGTIDFHSIFFLQWKSIVPPKSLATNSLQNISIYVQNKEIHKGLEQHDGKEIMTEFSFLGELCL